MEHEGNDVGAELGHEEGHALHHQPGDEMHVAAQAVELGHQQLAAQAPHGAEGSGELGAPVECVGSLANGTGLT